MRRAKVQVGESSRSEGDAGRECSPEVHTLSKGTVCKSCVYSNMRGVWPRGSLGAQMHGLECRRMCEREYCNNPFYT